jgi:hypothetical protein
VRGLGVERKEQGPDESLVETGRAHVGT